MPTSRDTVERRRLRRAVLRAHHPDLGGDAAELARRLRLLDAPGSGDGDEVVFVRRPRGLRRVTAWWRARRHRRRHPRVQ